MSEKRLVLLVPTEHDMTDEKALTTYWPNFVCRVKDALRRDGLDCKVMVVSPDAAKGGPR